MKLRPTQIVGLIAIVVFGGILILKLTQPSEKDRMDALMRSMPSMSTPQIEFPAVTLPDRIPIPELDLSKPAPGGTSSITTLGSVLLMPGEADPATVGSQAAKDDLYCAGVVSAEFDAKKDSTHPDIMSKWIKDQMALDAAGVAKLRAEGIVKDEFSAKYTLRWVDLAEADYKANKLRISVADCIARAASVPPAPN